MWPDVDVIDDSGSSPANRLVAACWAGNLAFAKAALAAGASVNEKGEVCDWFSAEPPLSAAVWRGHLDVVVWLLANGADPNADDALALDGPAPSCCTGTPPPLPEHLGCPPALHNILSSNRPP